jgi:hypothetical protein
MSSKSNRGNRRLLIPVVLMVGVVVVGLVSVDRASAASTDAPLAVTPYGGAGVNY